MDNALQEIRPGQTLNIATRQADSDTTLFFVHGGGGNLEQWRFQWTHFVSDSVNLVAWDAIGHGRSPKPKNEAAYAGAELVADAQAIFAAHCSTHNVVVAHSYGARLVLAWLLAEAPQVGTVVLLGAAPVDAMSGRRLIPGWLGRLPLPLLELARPLLARGFRRLAWHADADPALVAAEQRATRGNTLFMMQALFAGASTIDVEKLRHLPQEVYMLAGADDDLVPVAALKKLAALLPHATLQIVPRCGHQIMMEAPQVTNETIAAAIAAAKAARL